MLCFSFLNTRAQSTADFGHKVDVDDAAAEAARKKREFFESQQADK